METKKGGFADIVRLYDKIKRTGCIFNAEFIKKDGTLRSMTCRTGVKKYVTGGGMRYKPLDRGYLSVYDIQAKGYRLINLDTLRSVTLGGVKYTFNSLEVVITIMIAR